MVNESGKMRSKGRKQVAFSLLLGAIVFLALLGLHFSNSDTSAGGGYRMLLPYVLVLYWPVLFIEIVVTYKNSSKKP